MLLDGVPAGFTLAPLPPGAVVQKRAGSLSHSGSAPYDVGVLFAPDLAGLVGRWDAMHALVTPAGRLWVAWPKRASGLPTDLDEARVREYGLAHGRVDMKVCAIDETWSGLGFVVRLVDR